MAVPYNHKAIEKKWKEKWAENPVNPKVDENGRITFLKAGKVTITATAEADSSVKKSIELTVTGGETPAESGSGSTGTSTGKKGCGGSASGMAGLCALAALAAVVIAKKNKK